MSFVRLDPTTDVAHVIYMDSFEHYDTANASKKFTQTNDHALIAGGRNGRCIQLGNSACYKTFTSSYQDFSCGLAYKCNAFGNWIISFFDIDSDVGSLRVLADGRVYVTCRNGNSSTPLAFVLHTNVWYYIEFSVHATATSIQYEVHVNEQLVGSGTFSGLPASSLPHTDKPSQIRIIGPGAGNAAYVDDLWVDGNGDFLGDCRIGYIKGNTEGELTGWTPSPGPLHYTMLNELVPDGDNTIIYTATEDAMDCSHLDDITFTGTIWAIQGVIDAKKSDAGTAIINPLYRLAGVNAFGGDGIQKDLFPSETDYFYLLDVSNDKTLFGAAGSKWTVSDINNLQFGVKRNDV